MSIGIRLFHSRKFEQNYLLVKPKENKVYLYKLSNDGTIGNKGKPLLEKTYNKYSILRKGKFPSSDSFINYPHRYHLWKSEVPRNINKIPEGMGQSFSIRNRDGSNGLIVDIKGALNNKGNIEEVEKLQFPVSEGYNSIGITNLARIYLKKIFDMYTKSLNKNTYYVSKRTQKQLDNLDKEYNIPKFKITDKIKDSILKLCKKHGLEFTEN